jgi:hypothetical protein
MFLSTADHIIVVRCPLRGLRRWCAWSECFPADARQQAILQRGRGGWAEQEEVGVLAGTLLGS